MDETQDESRVVVVLQARMNARRLPGKPLLPLGDTTVLDQTLRRVQTARFGKRFIIATSDTDADAPLREYCKARNLPCYAGSPSDVLDRVINAGKVAGGEIIVRCLTSHPLVDPRMLDACARYALDSRMDYITVARLPQGVSCEAVPLTSLERTRTLTEDVFDREQVTSYTASHLEHFERAFLPPPMRLARKDVNLVLETPDDYQRLVQIYREVPAGSNRTIDVAEVLNYLDTHATGLNQAGHVSMLRAA